MTQDFVNELGLEFVKAPDIGDFWGAEDSCGEHSFELFITAGEEGPSSAQIERYRSFCENFDGIYGSICEKYRSHLAGLNTGQRSKWDQVPVEVIFVNVYDDRKNGDIELTCAAARGFLMFTRSLNFLATIRNSQLASFEVI